MTASRKKKIAREWTPVFGLRVTPQENGCWYFNGATSTFGYGSIRFKGKSTPAHRVSWIIANGKVPKGKWVLHKCDNPPCINWEHLELGDAKKNMLDCVKRGRHNQATKKKCRHGHPFSKENTRVVKKPKWTERICIICYRRTHRASYHRRKPIRGKK